MNCKRAKQELALSAGHDLDALTEQELRSHLANCPECYDQWNRVRGTTALLQQVAADEVASSDPPQLWNTLSQALPHASQRRMNSTGNRLSLSSALVPAVAVASLMFAIFSIQQSLDNAPTQSAAANGFQLTVDGVNHSESGSDSAVYPESHLQFDSASFPLEMGRQPPVDFYRESKSLEVAPDTQRAEETGTQLFLIR